MKHEEWPSAAIDLFSAFENLQTVYARSPESKQSSGDCTLILSGDRFDDMFINFLGETCSANDKGLSLSPNVTRIHADSRLWRRLISRVKGYRGFTPYHFNQAEIGSHFTWQREGPYRAESRFLNFFQTR